MLVEFNEESFNLGGYELEEVEVIEAMEPFIIDYHVTLLPEKIEFAIENLYAAAYSLGYSDASNGKMIYSDAAVFEEALKNTILDWVSLQ